MRSRKGLKPSSTGVGASLPACASSSLSYISLQAAPDVPDHQLLYALHHAGVVVRDLPGHLHPLGHQVVRRDQVVEQSYAVGLIGPDLAGGQQQVLGDRPPDLHRQAPRRVDAAVRGGQELEPAPLAADADVEAGSEHRRASEREPVDDADGRLGAGCDAPGVVGPLRVGRRRVGVFRQTGELVDVGARREGALAASRQDDRPDVRVVDHLSDGPVQLPEQALAQGVEHARTVEGEDSHAVDSLDEQIRFRQGRLSGGKGGAIIRARLRQGQRKARNVRCPSRLRHAAVAGRSGLIYRTDVL